MRLDQFQLGHQYEVGTTLGMLFLAEGWAAPVVNEKPALLLPLDEMEHEVDSHSTPRNLRREIDLPTSHPIPTDVRRRVRRR
jgi:hypothetical protein